MEKNDTSQAEVNLTQSIRRWQREISTRPSPTPFVVSSPFHATRIKRLKKHYPALSHPYLWLCPLFSCCNSEIRLVTWTNNLGPGLSATPRKLRRKTCQSFTTPPPVQSKAVAVNFYSTTLARKYGTKKLLWFWYFSRMYVFTVSVKATHVTISKTWYIMSRYWAVCTAGKIKRNEMENVTPRSTIFVCKAGIQAQHSGPTMQQIGPLGDGCNSAGFQAQQGRWLVMYAIWLRPLVQ